MSVDQAADERAFDFCCEIQRTFLVGRDVGDRLSIDAMPWNMYYSTNFSSFIALEFEPYLSAADRGFPTSYQFIVNFCRCGKVEVLSRHTQWVREILPPDTGYLTVFE